MFKRIKKAYYRDIYTLMFIAALFKIAKCPSIDEWINKEYIYAMEF
jgi:hypothetical protein